MLRKTVRYLFLFSFICTIFTFCKDNEEETVRDLLLSGKWYVVYWSGADDDDDKDCSKSSYLYFTSDGVAEEYDACYLSYSFLNWSLSSDGKELTFYDDLDKMKFTIMSISSTRLVLNGLHGQYIFKR
jgi:hypothetical protein